MTFENVYEDEDRARSYARLEFPGTYYLAYRDLPTIIARHVKGQAALDFGCGAGRSTRFLGKLGFDVVGVDISQSMIKQAREIDPDGDYRLVAEGDVARAVDRRFDLVLSAFTFDNIPTTEKKAAILGALESLLKPDGVVLNLVSSPEIYLHEWASFSTKDFPENRQARSGDRVKIIMKDVTDDRPVEDVLFTDGAYRELYTLAGFEVVEMHKPLATAEEPYQWVSETEIAPWVIYVLKPRSSSGGLP